MNQLFISGRDVTDDVTDFSEFTLEVGYNANKTIVTKLSEHFRFNSDTDTYKLLRDTFFNDCNGLDKELKGQFKTTICGGIVVPLTITVTDAVYCKEYIEVLMQSDDDDDNAYSKIDSTYWFDNDFGSAFDIPIMYFAVQPSFLSWVIVLLVAPIRVALNAIDKAINIVCKAVTLGELLGDCDVNLSGAVFRKLDNWLLGVGRWACAPLVREIITYQCSQAGLLFHSSILNDPASPYYNLAFFDLATGEKGSYKNTSAAERRRILYGNSYLMTTLELVQKLSEIFEADYKIIDGTLYIETKAYFDLLKNKEIAKSDDCTLFSYNLSDRQAYGVFSFADDYLDKEGNKAKKIYSTILEWNNPPSLSQKGKLERMHPFGKSRFMFDQFSHDKEGFFDIEYLIDELRDGPDKLLENFLGTDNIIRKKDLCISEDMLSYPKLIVLEDNFTRSDAAAIRKTYKRRNGKQFYIYNYPLLYKESGDKDINGQLVKGEKGDLAYYADKANPRLSNDLMMIDTLEIECSCIAVSNLVNNFHQCYIRTPYGKGSPESASIKFAKGKIMITFEQIVINC